MSDQGKRMEQKRAHRSQLSRQLLLQYVAAIVGYTISLLLLVLLSWRVLSSFTWYYDDPLYRFLRWIADYILLWIGLFLFGGWIIITYYFLSKPLKYLDEVILAAEQLAQPTDTSIRLPQAMKTVQDEMNLVREQALRNAMAAREAEQRKNDLIVYLAHDLKTPLTSVIGYLNLIQDEPDISPDVRAKYIGISLEKAQRLEDLINEFFEITRFNLTKLVLEPVRINLSRMLEQIAFEFNPILADKQLTWELKIEPDVEIMCDSGKLERVFDNLIRNSINYSYENSKISLTLNRIDKHILVTVKNRGRNIPTEKLSRIFEQFYRVDSSRSSATGGAGLGLAIAKEIVTLHGGAIKAESMDENIKFTVLLPVDCQKIV